MDNKKLSVSELCKEVKVSRKGYYKQLHSQAPGAPGAVDPGAKASAVLNCCMYLRTILPKAGVRTLHYECNKYFSGLFSVGRDRLTDLLRANGLLLKTKHRKRPPRTTQGVVNHGFEDHLNTVPKYIPTDHCRLVVSDITCVKTAEGFYYLSLTMDAYSRIITGYDLQRTLTTEGPMNALRQTVDFYHSHGFDVKGLIHHSDRGCQYVSVEMTDYEADLGIITGVTQTGDPLHNAMAERLNGTLKNDFLYSYDLLSFEQAKRAVEQSVLIYNTARPHQAIGMKTPMQTLIPDYPSPLSEGQDEELRTTLLRPQEEIAETTPHSPSETNRATGDTTL